MRTSNRIIITMSILIVLVIGVTGSGILSNPVQTFSVSLKSSNGTTRPDGLYNQTYIFEGKASKTDGQPLLVKVSKNGRLLQSSQISQKVIYLDGGNFPYKINVSGVYPDDTYRIDFIYDGQTLEKTLPLFTSNGMVSAKPPGAERQIQDRNESEF